jgi:hypothetical protein
VSGLAGDSFTSLPNLDYFEGKLNILYASATFHLFGLDDRIRIVRCKVEFSQLVRRVRGTLR